MNDLPPQQLIPADAPPRDRRIVWTGIGSVALHGALLALVLWPPLRENAEAAPPPAIEVELVPEISSSGPPPSSEEVSSEQPSSSVEPSSEAPESSDEPSAEPSSAAPSAEPSSAPASSAEPPSSAEASAASSADPSSAPDVSSAAPSGEASAASEPPPASQASAEKPPTPMAARPIVIPVGPSEDAPSGESSAADTGVSALTASTGEVADGDAAAPASEPDVATLELGALHSAKRFYLEAMLNAPNMVRVRDALETLPREKRLSQTCNIEAIAQIGNAGKGFVPDAVLAEAYAKAEVSGTRFHAPGAIFRSGETWHGLAYDCSLSEDLTTVTAFSYRLGADVTDAVVARLGKKR